MSIILALPAQKQVLNAYTLFVGQSPSAADFSAHVAFITANGADAYNAFLNSVAKDIPVATLASNMLTNLGLTGVFTQAEAVTYLTSNSSNLGGAMTAVATATLNYVSNATFAGNDLMVAASAAYVTTASNSLTYSTTATNTSAGSLNATAATVAGDIFTLTTGVDNSGTSAKVVNGLFTDTAGAETWNLTDTVAGTAATDDALNITVVGDATAGVTRAGLQTTAIENVNIKYVDGSVAQENTGLTLATGGLTGMTNLSVKDASIANTTATQADTVLFTGIASGVGLDISNNSALLDISATYAAAATASSADALTVALAGVNGVLTVGTGMESVALTSTGDAARLEGLVTTTATSATLAGTGLKIDNIMDATMTSFSAAESTGAVNVFLATGTTLTTATGGTGTTDVLAVNSLGLVQTLAGFETLVASGAAGTYDLTNAAGVTTLGVDTALTSTAFTNAAATQNTINISGGAQRTTAAAATGSLTTGTIGYALTTATGIADALTLAFDNGGTASTGTSIVGAVTANAIESITITEADWTGITIGGINTALTATGNYTLTASGASNLALGTVAVTSGLTTGTDTYNFADQTGTLSAILTNATNSVNFTSGTGVATITTTVLNGAADTGTYTLGNAANVVTMVGTATVADAGAHSFVGGTGNDTFILSGNGSIGAATTAAGTVTATAGFGTYTINGGTGTADKIQITQTGTASIDVITMSNIDQIVFQGGNKQTLTANVATGYADTVGVTFVGATTDVLNFAAASGGTLSLANVSQLGTGTIIALGAAGAETITASTTAAHQIDAAGGGDTITLTGSAGAIALVVDAGTSSAVATQATLVAGGTIAAAAAFATAGIDIVTGFATGDTIQLNKADGAVAITTAAAVPGVIGNGGTIGNATAGDVIQITGTFSSAGATFTAGAAAGDTDTAIIYDNNGTIAGGTYTAIVLVGYVDAGTTDTVGATGLFTGVA